MCVGIVDLPVRWWALAARRVGAGLAAALMALAGQAAPPAMTQGGAPPAAFVGQLGGLSLDLTLVGERHALVGLGPRLLVVDLERPEAPRWAGLSPVLGGAVRSIVVAGDRAYVAVGPAGVAVLDLTRIESPALLSRLPLTQWGRCAAGAVQDLALHDGRLFAAESRNGLSELSLADRDRPVRTGCLAHSVDGRSLVVDASRGAAFMADAQGRGWSVDVSAPGELRLVARDGFDAHDLALDGDRLVGLTHGASLDLWSIEAVDALRPLGSLAIIASGRRVAVAGDRAWVGTAAGQVLEVDLTDPSAPVLGRRFGLPGGALPPAVAAVRPWGDGRLLVLHNGALGAAALDGAAREELCGEGSGGLAVLDTASPRGQVVGGLGLLGCRMQSLAVTGGRTLWLAERLPDGIGSDRLLAFDVQDPALPRLLGQLVLPDGQPVLQLAQAGPALAILSWGKLILAEVRDGSPRVVGSLAGVPADLAAGLMTDYQRGIAVVAGQGHVAVMAIDDPARPRLLASVELPDDGLGAISQRGVEIGLHDLGGGWAMHAMPTGSLLVLDLRDPAQPRPARLWPGFFSVLRAAARDGRAYIADGEGLRSVDLRRRSELATSETIPWRSDGRTMVASGPWLLSLDGRAGLNALDVRDPATRPAPAWSVTAPELGALSDRPLDPDTEVEGGPPSVELAGGIVGAMDHSGLVFYRLGPATTRPSGPRVFLPFILRGQAAAPSRPPARRLEPLGTWTGLRLDDGRGLLAEGGRVYVGVDLGGAKGAGVAVLEARSGAGLVLLGVSPPVGRRVDALAMGADGLFVAGESNGGRARISFLEVADPTRIRVLGGLNVELPATALAADGRRAYLLFNGNLTPSDDFFGQAILAFDFADPARPRRGASLDLSDQGDSFGAALRIAGGRIYLANLSHGVEVYDIRDPGQINLVGVMPSFAGIDDFDVGAIHMSDLVVRGQQIVTSSVNFGGVNPGGLWALDIGDPHRPAETDSLVDLRLRARDERAKDFDPFEDELGGMHLAWDGSFVFGRLGGRIQAFHLGAGGFSLLDERRLPGDETDPIGGLDLSGSLIAATGGLAVAPTRLGLAVFRLQPR